MLMLSPMFTEDLTAQEQAVLILQCLQNEIIGKAEAKKMLFIDQIGAGK